MFVKIVKALNGILERMTPRQLLITAAVAGVVMCLLIYFTLRSFEEQIVAEQPEPVELKTVVVANVDISRGTTISADMMKLVSFSLNSVPKGSAGDIRAFQGLPARVDILRGDIITDTKVYSDIRQAGFIGMIPPDCRAVTIPIDNITGVAGLLKPGDYVDLLLISSGIRGGVKGEVILQNVMLLSINKNIDRLSGEIDVNPPNEQNQSEAEGTLKEARESAEQLADTAETMHNQASDTFAGKGFEEINSGGSMRGLGASGKGDGGGGDSGTATLALKPDDVLKIAASTQAGKIHLALRPFKPTPKGMFISETEYYSAPPAENRPASPPAPPVQRPSPTVPRVPAPNRPVVPPTRRNNPDSGFSYEVVKWGQ